MIEAKPVEAKPLVLVIDDDQDIRFTISEICKAAGWDVMTAADGAEGLDLFRQHQPAIVLVDYHMPRLDGLATVKKIRAGDKLTPVLVLTVEERQQIANSFLEAGATDFALKPIKAPDLISRIKVNLKIGDLLRSSAREKQEVFVDKGINSATLQLILNCLQLKESTVAIEDICQDVSLAYPTVHRYLQHLVETGDVGVEVLYGSSGKRGRPRNMYFLNNNPQIQS